MAKEILRCSKGVSYLETFFKKVPEPETSQSRLDEFEQKYGIESSEFYSLYYQGMDPIGDRFVADLWAFEYEINVRARELCEEAGRKEQPCPAREKKPYVEPTNDD